jgi:hypothetical protein
MSGTSARAGRQRPARLQQRQLRRGVHVAQQEPARAELAQQRRELTRGAVGLVRVGEALHHADAVGVGLQPADCPEAGVGERAIVEEC